MIFYEKFVFPKKHYVIFWIFSGLFYFGIQQFAMWLGKEEGLFWTRFIFTLVVISGLPISYITINYALKNASSNLKNHLIFPNNNKDLWINNEINNIFSFNSRLSFFVTISLNLLIWLIILTLDMPFKSNIFSKVFMLLIMEPVWMFGGHAAYIVYELLKFLVKITSRKIKSGFLAPPLIIVRPLTTIYSRIAFLALLLYSLHVLALWLSPYATTPQIISWVVFTGFFPFALFIFSTSQTFKLIRAIKFFHVEKINREVQLRYVNLHNKPSKENAEVLEIVVRIQKEAENIKEWPVEFESLFTFLVTLVIPSVQLILTIFGDPFT